MLIYIANIPESLIYRHAMPHSHFMSAYQNETYTRVHCMNLENKLNLPLRLLVLN